MSVKCKIDSELSIVHTFETEQLKPSYSDDCVCVCVFFPWQLFIKNTT